MSDSPESPAMRQARLRREKREAKIKSGGADRLDRITRLSGRTPESMRNASPPSTSPSPSPAPQTSYTPPRTDPFSTTEAQAQQQAAQQEFLRAMMRDPASAPAETPNAAEDPMLKILAALTGDGTGAGIGDLNDPAGLSLSPDELLRGAGVPGWAAKMAFGSGSSGGGFGGVREQGPSERKAAHWWEGVNVVFSILVGLYLLYRLADAGVRFGVNPPPPATASSPFVVFLVGEILLRSTRIVLSGGARVVSAFGWFREVKGVVRDGGIVLFLLGAFNWWKGDVL